MKHAFRGAPVLALGLVMTLGGCLGSGSGGGGGGNGGGGGGGGGGSAAFEDAYDEVVARTLTSDMPTDIEATYEGQFKVGASGNADLLGGANASDLEILGDLTLEVDWSVGSNDPFSGTASNMVATDVASGNSTQLNGTLNVAPGQLNQITRTTIPAIPGLSPEVHSGSMNVTLAGDVENDGDEGRVYVVLNGQFYGSEGEAMVGGVSGGINDMDNPDQQIFDAPINGTFYASQ